MAGLDTNVLVRLLTEDGTVQAEQVKALIGEAIARQQTLFIPITVVLELEWVLRSRYQFDRAMWTESLMALLTAQEFEFQFEKALDIAVQAYSSSTADFADCLHASLCGESGQAPLVTFDAKAAKVEGVELLGETKNG
jgi:predicted nucleic-acid-binding protein